MQIQAMST